MGEKTTAAEFASAIAAWLSVWRDGYLLSDLGPHLTCSEADALKDFLIALGEQDSAESLISGHADADDEGDIHYNEENA